MSGGKGGGQTVEMPKFQKEGAKWGLGEARRLYEMGGPQYYPNPTYVPFGQDTLSALEQMRARSGGSALEQGLSGWLSNSLNPNNSLYGGVQGLLDTSSGNFLNANPYLDATFNKAAGQVTDQWKNSILPGLNATFGAAGGYNDSTHPLMAADLAGEFGDTLSGLATNIYGGNYLNERNNMVGAQGQLADMWGQQGKVAASLVPTASALDWQNIGQLGQVGSAYEGKEFEKLQDDMNRFNHGQQQPYNMLDWYMGNVMGNGMMGQQTSNAQGSQLSGALGGALGGAGLASALSLSTPWTWGLAGIGGLLGLL